VEIIHQIQERGIVLPAKAKESLETVLIPYRTNLQTLIESFPVFSDSVNEEMRSQDDLLRSSITRQYREYLDRFASRNTPSGTDFSRALFQVEGMAGIIREIRKSARLLQKT